MNAGILSPTVQGQAQPGVPFFVTQLTSGTGSFKPLARTRWMKVTLVGAGGAGGNTNSSASAGFSPAGLHGSVLVQWVKVAAPVYSYAVGAGAAAGSSASGGDTTFGSLTAYGGAGGFLSSAGTSVARAQNGPFGKGGGVSSNVGLSATGFGAGGGGGAFDGGGGNGGGAGAGGLIMIEEY